ncbi:GDSL esterase/lipase-like protein [Drosera capensis]
MEHFKHRIPYVYFFITLSIIFCSSSAQREQLGRQYGDKASKGTPSAIFVFGDSTVDPGNNNYILTLVRANFPPYGRDFPNHVATGRFSNGFLATDFIAKHYGIKKYVPAYLDPTLSDEELMTGVSFGSALSGFDPLTSQFNGVISMVKQVEYFKECKSRIDVVLGKEKANELINKSVFIVSAGTNDFVANYFASPIRQAMFSVAEYQHFLLQNVHNFIMELWKEGATKIAMAGLPPIGCLPMVITLYAQNLTEHRACLESLSSVAREYNHLLQQELNTTLDKLTMYDHHVKLVYLDIYDPMESMIHQAAKFGFKEVSRGCCGTGYLESSFLCNSLSPVCEDAAKYVFWDSIHPTERTYYLLSKSARRAIDSVIVD